MEAANDNVVLAGVSVCTETERSHYDWEVYTGQKGRLNSWLFNIHGEQLLSVFINLINRLKPCQKDWNFNIYSNFEKQVKRLVLPHSESAKRAKEEEQTDTDEKKSHKEEDKNADS